MIKKIIALAILCAGINAQTIQELNKKINHLSDKIDSMESGKPSFSNISFGGYGEIIYTNKRSKKENNTKASHSNNPKTDALRNILYVGYEFSKDWKLITEIEVEHANEIFLEQGYLDYNFMGNSHLMMGLQLVPMGIQNLKHEPTTFLGVNRTTVENKIIPSTWRENGVSYAYQSNKVNASLGLITGQSKWI